jgi:hypothetical protein
MLSISFSGDENQRAESNPNLAVTSPDVLNRNPPTTDNENADLDVTIELDNSLNEDAGSGIHA